MKSEKQALFPEGNSYPPFDINNAEEDLDIFKGC